MEETPYYRIRPFCRGDYPDLATWQALHGLPFTPLTWYPSQGGFVVERDGFGLVAAGFCYQMSDTPIFWIDGIISNPEAEKQDRAPALSLLLQCCEDFARGKKGHIVMGSPHTRPFAEKFAAHGFNDSGRTYFHMGKGI